MRSWPWRVPNRGTQSAEPWPTTFRGATFGSWRSAACFPRRSSGVNRFSIDLDIETDLTDAGRTDELADTIDYGAVAAAVVELAENQRFNLLERFAVAVAEVVLGDRRATAVSVTISKLRPPVPHDLAASAVSIRRPAS